MRAKSVSNQPVSGTGFAWTSFTSIGTRIGISVSDTAADTRIESVTTMANSWKRRPIVPGMKKIGMNTATSEIEIDITVNATSFAPRTAASNGRMPASMCRMMFSSTTIASSTTRPTAMVRPMSEMLSRLRPSAIISANVPSSEIGRLIDGIRVAATRLRKSRITVITRPIVTSIVTFTSWIALRIEIERSLSS